MSSIEEKNIHHNSYNLYEADAAAGRAAIRRKDENKPQAKVDDHNAFPGEVDEQQKSQASVMAGKAAIKRSRLNLFQPLQNLFNTIRKSLSMHVKGIIEELKLFSVCCKHVEH